MLTGLIFRLTLINKVDPPGSTPNIARRSRLCQTQILLKNQSTTAAAVTLRNQIRSQMDKKLLLLVLKNQSTTVAVNLT
jgi:hypothetical protein